MRAFSLVLLIAVLASVTGVPAAPARLGPTAPVPSGPTSPPGMARKPEPIQVRLPRDHAAHPDVDNEWWYLIGHVWSGDHEFGFEIDLNRLGTFHGLLSLWRSDLAITDVGGDRHTAQLSYFLPSQGSASTTMLDVRVPTGRITGPFVRDITAEAVIAPTAQHVGGSISVRLRSRKEPLFIGGTGFLPFGDGFTYYYSMTDLDAMGVIELDGTQYPVRGYAWLDRQWGDWNWPSLRGWTWFAIQLDNGVQLNLAKVDQNGDERLDGYALERDGRQRFLPIVDITPTGETWTSPVSGKTYNTGWTVRIPTVRSVLHIQSLVQDQELPEKPPFSAASIYEGTCSVRGTYQGRPQTGRCYAEQNGNFG